MLRKLDDRLLHDCRHPAEWPALAAALAVVVALLGIALLVDEKVALVVLFIVASFVAVVFLESLQATRAIATAAEITPTQYPELYPLVAELRQRWAMPRTRVFIRYWPDVSQSVAYGFHEPYVIVIDQLLVSVLDAEEMKYVIGREMAHIKFGHTRLRAFFGSDDLEMPPLLEWFSSVRDVAFSGWGRAQTLTGDRAGLIACGRPSKALSALIKSTVGPWLDVHPNIDELIAQAEELSRGWERLAGFVAFLTEWQPPLAYRLQAILEWSGGLEPDHTLSLRAPQASGPRDHVPSQP